MNCLKRALLSVCMLSVGSACAIPVSKNDQVTADTFLALLGRMTFRTEAERAEGLKFAKMLSGYAEKYPESQYVENVKDWIKTIEAVKNGSVFIDPVTHKKIVLVPEEVSQKLEPKPEPKPEIKPLVKPGIKLLPEVPPKPTQKAEIKPIEEKIEKEKPFASVQKLIEAIHNNKIFWPSREKIQEEYQQKIADAAIALIKDKNKPIFKQELLSYIDSAIDKAAKSKEKIPSNVLRKTYLPVTVDLSKSGIKEKIEAGLKEKKEPVKIDPEKEKLFASVGKLIRNISNAKPNAWPVGEKITDDYQKEIVNAAVALIRAQQSAAQETFKKDLLLYINALIDEQAALAHAAGGFILLGGKKYSSENVEDSKKDIQGKIEAGLKQPAIVKPTPVKPEVVKKVEKPLVEVGGIVDLREKEMLALQESLGKLSAKYPLILKAFDKIMFDNVSQWELQIVEKLAELVIDKKISKEDALLYMTLKIKIYYLQHTLSNVDTELKSIEMLLNNSITTVENKRAAAVKEAEKQKPEPKVEQKPVPIKIESTAEEKKEAIEYEEIKAKLKGTEFKKAVDTLTSTWSGPLPFPINKENVIKKAVEEIKNGKNNLTEKQAVLYIKNKIYGWQKDQRAKLAFANTIENVELDRVISDIAKEVEILLKSEVKPIKTKKPIVSPTEPSEAKASVRDVSQTSKGLFIEQPVMQPTKEEIIEYEALKKLLEKTDLKKALKNLTNDWTEKKAPLDSSKKNVAEKAVIEIKNGVINEKQAELYIRNKIYGWQGSQNALLEQKIANDQLNGVIADIAKEIKILMKQPSVKSEKEELSKIEPIEVQQIPISSEEKALFAPVEKLIKDIHKIKKTKKNYWPSGKNISEDYQQQIADAAITIIKSNEKVKDKLLSYINTLIDDRSMAIQGFMGVGAKTYSPEIVQQSKDGIKAKIEAGLVSKVEPAKVEPVKVEPVKVEPIAVPKSDREKALEPVIKLIDNIHNFMQANWPSGQNISEEYQQKIADAAAKVINAGKITKNDMFAEIDKGIRKEAEKMKDPNYQFENKKIYTRSNIDDSINGIKEKIEAILKVEPVKTEPAKIENPEAEKLAQRTLADVINWLSNNDYWEDEKGPDDKWQMDVAVKAAQLVALDKISQDRVIAFINEKIDELAVYARVAPLDLAQVKINIKNQIESAIKDREFNKVLAELDNPDSWYDMVLTNNVLSEYGLKQEVKDEIVQQAKRLFIAKIPEDKIIKTIENLINVSVMLLPESKKNVGRNDTDKEANRKELDKSIGFFIKYVTRLMKL